MYRHRDDYRATLWVAADSHGHLVSDFVGIAELLELPHSDPDHAIAQVKAWLETHPGWLLVFDNADAPDILDPFLPLRSKGNLLLTSRTQLLDRLRIANSILLDGMASAEATAFLEKRVGRDVQDEGESKAIESLAQELDYRNTAKVAKRQLKVLTGVFLP